MSLSPEERALDILDDIVEAESWPQKKRDLFIQGCAAQIREVEEIAADRNYKEPDQARWFRHGFKEGFNAAKEKAARIVENRILSVSTIIPVTTEIRQMEVE